MFKIITGYRDRYSEIMNNFILVLEKEDFGYYISGDTSQSIYANIVKVDDRIECTDAFILASAIEKGIDVFVTLDTELVDNRTIENKFKISIRHPDELV